MKLEELQKMSAALSSSKRGSKRGRGRKGKRRAKVVDGGSARSNMMELAALHSSEELSIEYDAALGSERGDLVPIRREVFRCHPVAESLAHIPLILKRLEAVDRRTYDLKVYEADAFQRFRGHPNIISLYSYWAEAAPSAYAYKVLVFLVEEGVGGSMRSALINSRARRKGWVPTERLALRIMCDVSKALIALHNCRYVHGRVKPSNIFLDSRGTAMLGEMGRTELDGVREARPHLSKVLVGEAMPAELVYWAPEVLSGEEYGEAADLWALGVALYELATGVHPFPLHDEMEFREAVLSVDVDWDRLEGYPILRSVLEHLLVLDPAERWTAHETLESVQDFFVVYVQKAFRGYVARKKYMDMRDALTVMQAHVRGWVARRDFEAARAARIQAAIVKIQSTWRMRRERVVFLRRKKAIMVCQGNVKARHQRRRYERMKRSAFRGQMLVRRYLAMKWMSRVRTKRMGLESKCRDLSAMLARYSAAAEEFKSCFPAASLPYAMRHLESFEDYEVAMAEAEAEADAEEDAMDLDARAYMTPVPGTPASLRPASSLRPTSSRSSRSRAGRPPRTPKLVEAKHRIRDMEEELEDRERRLAELERERHRKEEEDSKLRDALGDRYDELEPMVEHLKSKMMELAAEAASATPCALRLAHEYEYSNWDRIHEPDNIADNVLLDDDSVWKTLSPEIDVELSDSLQTYVASVELFLGDCGPASVSVSISDDGFSWEHVQDFKCTSDPHQLFNLSGEPVGKYLRLHMPNNIRGGNYVSVRHVVVRGVVREEVHSRTRHK